MWSYFRPWKAGRMDIPGFIREAKNAGAEGVELLDFFYKNAEEDRVAARETIAETGLTCPIFSISQNFAKPSPEERTVELNKIIFGIGEAKYFGAGVVRVFAGNLADGITLDDAMEWIVEGLAQASLAAHEAGVSLALENHGKLAGRSDQVRDIINRVHDRSKNQNLRVNPDTGNFMLVGQKSDVAVTEVADLAAMVHFKDFKHAPANWEGFAYEALDGTKYVGTAVGEGEVNLEACINGLKKGGFDGWLSVEYEGEEDAMEAVPRSIANARRYL